MAKKATTKKPAAKAKAPTAATSGKTAGKGTKPQAAPKRPTRAKSGAQDGKRLSLLDAAYQVLKGRKNPMKVSEIYEAVIEKGLWKPGKGKTPQATLAAGVVMEINKKGEESRFVRVDRGSFLAR